jgi:DNA (cytosine-5)-methyltransferase 1
MRKQRKTDLHIADLFAGGGGFSTGVAQACKELDKRPDLVAINHWKTAIETHQRNHPWARHFCTGLDVINPTEATPSSRLNLLCASPECTHHSNARGGRPMNDQSRASAWLILKWLQELYVESVLIENVQEFADWGPLGADGRPLQSMRGQLFEQFLSSLRALGYNVEWRVLNAANYGGATTRERLFIMARRGRNKRLVWPDPTHCSTAHMQAEMFEQRARWRAAREIIDWSLPSQSIFRRKQALAPATMERIAAGLRRFGGKNAEPFLVVLRNHMNAQSIHDPLPTLTAGGRHVGLCQPFVLGQQSGGAPRSVDQPLPTVSTDGAIALVEPYLVPLIHGMKDKRSHPIDQPLPTITTMDAMGLVQPFIITAGGPTGQGRSAKSVNDPLPTVLTFDHHALVEPFLVEYRGNHKGKRDGHRRVASLDSPLPTQDTSNRFGVVEPIIIEAAPSSREKRETCTAKDRFGVVEPYIVSYYGNHCLTPVSEPLPTCTAKDRFGLVQFGTGLYLDIHFRMLQWHELAAAMGFPPDYEFAGTREDKVRQIGQAVEVRTAKALVRSALAA